ncbi:hypothetical protein P3T73_02685 [Kiritimatiellota bacterium B12222]|nr:hypothetical protein P3T73_02685 [Kiritimatiellota bacterium B12222]
MKLLKTENIFYLIRCFGMVFVLVLLWIVVDRTIPQAQRFEVFPPSIPEELSIREEELPLGYALIQDEASLQKLSLERNPGYLTLPAEHAALAPRGGLCSIAGMYEHEDHIRLMLNAVYFRDADHCKEFVEIESQKGLHMAAFRKKLSRSEWIIFIASDPEQSYSEREREAFGVMIEKYQRRLKLDLLFDELSAPEL